jgi:hypothetical protein
MLDKWQKLVRSIPIQVGYSFGIWDKYSNIWDFKVTERRIKDI